MSSLADKLRARAAERPTLDVPISDIVSSNAPDGVVKVRVPPMADVFDATEAAVQFRKKLLASLPDTHAKAFLDDASFLEDAKQAEILWRAYRDEKDPTKPAFPSPEWMRNTFTAHEFSRLYLHFERAVEKDSAPDLLLTQDQREAFAKAIALASEFSDADRVVARLSRLVLVDLLLWVCREWSRSLPSPSAEV